MLAMLPPSITSAHLESFVYTKACQELLDTGHRQSGVEALKSAIKQWPDYWLGYFLLANHYLLNTPDMAITWYQKGFPFGKTEVPFLNNYAYALGQVHCYSEAQVVIERALILAPDDVNVLDTQQQLKLASELQTEKKCGLVTETSKQKG
jgi:tetratricopeptide (TPR) repeat protein